MQQMSRWGGVGVLLLAAALSACAPAATGPGRLPVTVTGQAFDVAVKVPVEQVTPSTPDSVYVTFPDCPAAVSVTFVRERGVAAGAEACRATGSETGRNILKAIGVGVGVGLVAFVTFIWALISALGTG